MAEKPFFTPEQREQVKKLFCKGLNPEQQEQFCIVCERMQLDPFTRQIYARAQNVNKGDDQNPRWEKELVIITSIDGMRTIAERTGQYRGQTIPEFYYAGDEGKVGWFDVWVGKGDNQLSVPEAARIGVYRETFPHPLVRVARYHSFVQYAGRGNNKSPTAFWRRMPDVMLLKCAEAAALRAAFPLFLGGVYIEEEVAANEEASGAPEGELPPSAGEAAPTAGEATTAPAATTKATRQRKAAEKTEPPAPAATPPADPAPAAPATPPASTTPPPAAAPAPAAPEDEDLDLDEDAPEWKNHVIACVNHTDFKGKKIGDLDLSALDRLKRGWVDKKAETIKTNPVASKEAALILEAIAAKSAS